VQIVSPLRSTQEPARVLASAQMKSLVRRLRQSCDLVVIDGPPLFAGGEVLSLARISNAVLVVGNSRALSEGAAARAVEALQSAGPASVGVVVAG
jgi:Mrp family chromosome partitioning ATPase